MLRYLGYLDKGFFSYLEQCPNEFKHIKKLQQINDTTIQKKKIILGQLTSDISHKAPSDERHLKWHENKKPPPPQNY